MAPDQGGFAMKLYGNLAIVIAIIGFSLMSPAISASAGFGDTRSPQSTSAAVAALKHSVPGISTEFHYRALKASCEKLSNRLFAIPVFACSYVDDTGTSGEGCFAFQHGSLQDVTVSVHSANSNTECYPLIPQPPSSEWCGSLRVKGFKVLGIARGTGMSCGASRAFVGAYIAACNHTDWDYGVCNVGGEFCAKPQFEDGRVYNYVLCANGLRFAW